LKIGIIVVFALLIGISKTSAGQQANGDPEGVMSAEEARCLPCEKRVTGAIINSQSYVQSIAGQNSRSSHPIMKMERLQ
jgi:hypothetical protein